MSPRINKLIYYSLFSVIIIFSAVYYLPCFYAFLNSDQAMHVLMTKNFQLPRDYYYWGQNRLGSILPMISSWIYAIVKVHPIYICSVVHYLFLLIPFLVIAKQIKNTWLKLAFLCLIFLPFNSYNAILYIGHPYSQQFFCGTLFIAFFLKAHKLLKERDFKDLSKKDILTVCLSFAFSAVFYVLGIWVSEFNAVLIVVPFGFIIRYLKGYFVRLSKKHLAFLLVAFLLPLLGGYKWYKHTKDVSIVDAQYNKTFILDKESISAEYNFMMQKIADAFKYDNPYTRFENTIYIFLFIVILYLIFKHKEIRNENNNTISVTLIITAVVSSVMLFFSFWNLKSEFCPRYYIPVYIMLSLALIFYLDKTKLRFAKPLFFIIILFHCYMYSYNSLIRLHAPQPMKKYADFNTLPKGTLIADYWETYLINAVAIDSLQSINFDDQIVRNYDWREIPLSEKRFYFLNNPAARQHRLGDNMTQFNVHFVFTGKKYSLKAFEVWEYKRVN